MEAEINVLVLLLVGVFCDSIYGTPNGNHTGSTLQPAAVTEHINQTSPILSDTSASHKPAPIACSRHSCYDVTCSQDVTIRRDCHCDPLCLHYNDCCADYVTYCNQGVHSPGNVTSYVGKATGVGQTPDGEGSPPGDDLTRCIQTIDFDPAGNTPRSGHRLISLCPSSWSGGADIRQLCQKIQGGLDGFLSVPVIAQNDGRHFKNVYCAMCHGFPVENLTYWTVSYQEEKPGAFGEIVNASRVVQLANGPNSSKFITKVVDPPYLSPDERTTSPPRSCVIVDVTYCPIGAAEDACGQKFAPIAIDGTTYRNTACASCGVSTTSEDESLEVLYKEYCKEELVHISGTLSMATLLIFNDRTDVTIDGVDGGSASCSGNQIYDPFLEFCRDLSCPGGFSLTDDGTACVRSNRTSHVVDGYANNNTSDRSLVTNVEVALTLTGRFHNESDNLFHSGGTSWEDVANQTADYYLSAVDGCPGIRNGCELNFELAWECSFNSTPPANLNSSETCVLHDRRFLCSVDLLFDSANNATDSYLSFKGNFQEACFHGLSWNSSIRISHVITVAPCLPTELRRDNVTVLKVTYEWDEHSKSLALRNTTQHRCETACPLLTFPREDFVFEDALNESIRLTQHERVFRGGEFALTENGEVEVCNFLLPSQRTVTEVVWDPAHAVITAIGSCLSLVGITVTIATYVAFPTLRRNAAGKSLMSLVAALFVAQSTMLAGLQRTETPALCTAFAMTAHLFWLTAFFWMNVLAIDIYRTFGVGARLRLAHRDPIVAVFRRYALYAWGVPALIVGSCAFLSFCACSVGGGGLDVHYGSSEACWIGGEHANMAAFGVPVVVILFSNAVLFMLTMAGVRTSRRASERLNVTEGQGILAKRASMDLILYLKLTTIMGFTWTFGFAASFSGVDALWYPFLVLNSLQGALICLAFVCNDRVLAMWKARLSHWRPRRVTARGRYTVDSVCRSVEASGAAAADAKGKRVDIDGHCENGSTEMTTV